MAERQQHHRHELVMKAYETNRQISCFEMKLEQRGQWFAFAIAVIALMVSAFLGYQKAQIGSAIVGGGGIIGLVTAFLRRGRSSAPTRAMESKTSQKQNESK